jgi:hypothetical protein
MQLITCGKNDHKDEHASMTESRTSSERCKNAVSKKMSALLQKQIPLSIVWNRLLWLVRDEENESHPNNDWQPAR